MSPKTLKMTLLESQTGTTLKDYDYGLQQVEITFFKVAVLNEGGIYDTARSTVGLLNLIVDSGKVVNSYAGTYLQLSDTLDGTVAHKITEQRMTKHSALLDLVANVFIYCQSVL